MTAATGFRAVTVAVEALGNLKANPFTTLVVVLAALLAGVGVPTATLLDVQAIRQDEQAEISAGSNVIRITGENRVSLSAARCEELNTQDGVLAAGGLASRSTVSPVARPNDRVTVLSGTATLAKVLWPGGEAVPPAATVVVGSASARVLGLGPQSFFSFTVRPDPTALSVPVDRVAQPSTRDEKLDASVFVARPPTGDVIECLVEAKPGVRTQVESIAAGWFAESGSTVVSPFYLTVTAGANPEERLSARLTQHLPVLAAVVVGAAMLTAWFSRRAEYSLYRMLGMRTSGFLLMLATEMVAAGLMPLCLGFTATLVWMDVFDELDVILATGDALRAAVLVILIPVAGWLLMRPLTKPDALHGR